MVHCRLACHEGLEGCDHTQADCWSVADFCANSYRELLLGPAANPQLHSCPRRPGILERDEKRVARFLRWAAMQDGHVSSDDEAAVAQRLLDTVMMSVVSGGCVVSDDDVCGKWWLCCTL